MRYYIFGHSIFDARRYAEGLLLEDHEWHFIEPYNRDTEWLLLTTDWSDATMVVLTVTNLQTFRILAYCQAHGATLDESAARLQSAIDHYALDDLQWFD